MASGHERYGWGAKVARGVWSFALICRSLIRALITSAALAAGVLLAGCNSDEISLANNAKANQPVPPKLVADMAAKDMDLQSPMLVRLFKQEAELEVWKQDRSGRFGLLKTYPICRWSGDLGPKVREGDRQAPEGFYSINPGQMNPQSAYYLSFNTGYPNAYDKSLGHTGSQLMVHGDCSSRGCYAMTDEQIAEIYSLGRESFFGGQRAFQLQANPFKVTPQEPKVDFCEKKYVFDAAKPPDATKDLVFDASAKCPAYVIPDEVANAVRDKQQADQAETAQLVAKGTPVARSNTGIDGGMNRVFASKLPDGSTGLSEGGDGQGLSLVALSRAPGTIPSHVNPPRGPVTSPEEPLAASMAPAQAPAPATRVASAVPNAQSDGFFSNLARKVGLGGADTTATAQPIPAKPKVIEAKRNPPPRPETTAPKADPKASTPAASETKQIAAARPLLKPSPSDTPTTAAPAPKDGQVAGPQPMLPPNSFDNRF